MKLFDDETLSAKPLYRLSDMMGAPTDPLRRYEKIVIGHLNIEMVEHGDPMIRILGADAKLDVWAPAYTKDGMPIKMRVQAYLKLPKPILPQDKPYFLEKAEKTVLEVAEGVARESPYDAYLDKEGRGELTMAAAEIIQERLSVFGLRVLAVKVSAEPMTLYL